MREEKSSTKDSNNLKFYGDKYSDDNGSNDDYKYDDRLDMESDLSSLKTLGMTNGQRGGLLDGNNPN